MVRMKKVKSILTKKQIKAIRESKPSLTKKEMKRIKEIEEEKRRVAMHRELTEEEMERQTRVLEAKREGLSKKYLKESVKRHMKKKGKKYWERKFPEVLPIKVPKRLISTEQFTKIIEGLHKRETILEKDWIELQKESSNTNERLRIPGSNERKELTKLRNKFPTWAAHIHIMKRKGKPPFAYIDLPSAMKLSQEERQLLGFPRTKKFAPEFTPEAVERIRKRKRGVRAIREAELKKIRRKTEWFSRVAERELKKLDTQLRMLKGAIKKSTTNEEKRERISLSLYNRLMSAIQEQET